MVHVSLIDPLDQWRYYADFQLRFDVHEVRSTLVLDRAVQSNLILLLLIGNQNGDILLHTIHMDRLRDRDDP